MAFQCWKIVARKKSPAPLEEKILLVVRRVAAFRAWNFRRSSHWQKRECGSRRARSRTRRPWRDAERHPGPHQSTVRTARSAWDVFRWEWSVCPSSWCNGRGSWGNGRRARCFSHGTSQPAQPIEKSKKKKKWAKFGNLNKSNHCLMRTETGWLIDWSCFYLIHDIRWRPLWSRLSLAHRLIDWLLTAQYFIKH